MNSKPLFIKYLDNPKMLLGMAMNDLLCLGVPIYLGVCIKKVFLMSCIGFITFYLKRKASRIFPKYYLRGLFYWHFPTKVVNRFLKINLIPSNERFYLR